MYRSERMLSEVGSSTFTRAPGTELTSGLHDKSPSLSTSHLIPVCLLSCPAVVFRTPVAC